MAAERNLVGFFDRPDDQASQDFSGEALERIEAGGVLSRAERRLRSLSGPGAPFTSTLSVSEYALLKQLGPTPLAQVLGASVHQGAGSSCPPTRNGAGRCTASSIA